VIYKQQRALTATFGILLRNWLHWH